MPGRHTPKMIASTCRKRQYLSECQKYSSSFTSCKESCNLNGQQHFGSQLENQNFVRYGIGAEISITILVFILDYFQEKLTKFFKKKKNKKPDHQIRTEPLKFYWHQFY